ncbi:hypothetical protein M7I_7996 [Glarea lozoyensis 74030]|uniref:Uncharacterized protein n=1 Tax=Glarea lozoyensis (strain ATCC 74030 / MF5533) TaxID=1104152 RepID=H0EYT6_GLAL7|nr:hypothetical protein M7I_7996 [Glarea lozoyensis 74030]
MPAEDLEQEKALFIPFPGTTKQLRPKPYRGSDPEWKEFIKFSKDRSLQDKVRDSVTVFKIRQVLWPSALVQSFWNFTKVLFVEDSKRVAGMLGIQTQNPQLQSIDQMLARQQQMIKTIPNKNGPGQLSPGTGDASKSIIKVPTPVPAGSQGQNSEGEELGVAQKAVVALQQRFFAPLLAFRSKLMQTWRPAPSYPPRGSILVSGMVELESSRAYLVFDVRAAWDPKEKAYDARSMQLKLRRFQFKQQGPGLM